MSKVISSEGRNSSSIDTEIMREEHNRFIDSINGIAGIPTKRISLIESTFDGRAFFIKSENEMERVLRYIENAWGLSAPEGKRDGFFTEPDWYYFGSDIYGAALKEVSVISLSGYLDKVALVVEALGGEGSLEKWMETKLKGRKGR